MAGGSSMRNRRTGEPGKRRHGERETRRRGAHGAKRKGHSAWRIARRVTGSRPRERVAALSRGRQIAAGSNLVNWSNGRGANWSKREAQRA